MQNNYFSMNGIHRAEANNIPSMNTSADTPETSTDTMNTPANGSAGDTTAETMNGVMNGSMNGGVNGNTNRIPGGSNIPMTLPSFPDTPVYNPEDGTINGGSNIPQILPSFPDTPVYNPPGGTNTGPIPTPDGSTNNNTGSSDIPMTLPSFPDTPVASPIPPLYPSIPVERYTNIRILHADENVGAVSVILNGTTLTEGLTYGNITAYTTEAAGNILITVVSTANPARYIVQETQRFNYGDTYTIALIPFDAGGGANPATGFNSVLFKIEDTSCNKSLYNACIRAINLSTYENPLSVSLLDGRVIAQNLSYKGIGNFRQFTPGRYRVLVYENACNNQIQPRSGRALNSAVIGVIPIVIGSSSASCMANLLAASQISVGSSAVYTFYVLGNPYTSGGLKVLFVESYFDA